MLVHHLAEDGTEASIRRDGIELTATRVRLQLRPDRDNPPREGDPAVFVWLDVHGIDRRVLSVDISGWGTTPMDQASDLVHGIARSILPAIRWLAGDPKVHGTRTFASAPGWEFHVGVPWVVVATTEPTPTPDELAEAIRASAIGDPSVIVDRLGDVIAPLTGETVPHWIKVYIARNPSGPDGRIDVDNRWSWPGTPLAASYEWPSDSAIQLVRQLVVMKPSGGTSEPASSGRRNLFGRLVQSFRPTGS